MLHWYLPESPSQIKAGVNLSLTQAWKAFINAWERIRDLYCDSVEGVEVAAEPQLPIFLFDHHNPTRPMWQRRLDHAQSQEVAYLLIGGLRLVRRHSSSAFTVRCSTRLHLNRMLSYCAAIIVRLVFHELVIKFGKDVVQRVVGGLSPQLLYLLQLRFVSWNWGQWIRVNALSDLVLWLSILQWVCRGEKLELRWRRTFWLGAQIHFGIDPVDKIFWWFRFFHTFVPVRSSTLGNCMGDYAYWRGSTLHGAALYILGIACQIANRDIKPTCLSDSGNSVFH